MMRASLLVFAAAVALYLPTARYGFVQDDWAIVARNPAVHSPAASLRAVNDPYWPPPSEAGLWRPLTIISFALDWALGRGRSGFLHVANAGWHGLASVLVLVLVGRWLPRRAAVAAALAFAVHPVHVEAVAGLVGRAELLATVGILGTVAAVRARRWAVALALASAAMLSKEYGVVVGGVLLLYCWLDPDTTRPPRPFWLALAGLTVAYLAAWRTIGGAGVTDVAAPFLGASAGERLALALPATARAARLLFWPATLSTDYGPQVIPVTRALTGPAVVGACAIVGVMALVWAGRRRAPALAWAAGAAALAYLPTSNLLFASGIVLAERSLYLPVLLPAVALGMAAGHTQRRAGGPAAVALTALVLGALLVRSAARLPDWRSNQAYLVALLREHPESARAQVWAASVLAGMGDTAGARARYARAVTLYDRDPWVLGAAALFHLGRGDSTAAEGLARRARQLRPRERDAVRVELLLARGRGDVARAAALADSAARWFPREHQLYIYEPE